MMSSELVIGGRIIDKNSEPFIIAEAGINHNGKIELAKKMIKAAKDAGADAIKFQTYKAEEFVQDKKIDYTYYSQGKRITESMFEMFKRCEFSDEEWYEIKDKCVKEDIIFLSTPQNVSDLLLLLQIGIEAIKIGSDDFTNIPLIRRYAQENLPLIVSCGMASTDEISLTIKTIKDYSANKIVLLLCTSEYPTPPSDVNILRISSLQEEYPDVLIGLSDHTRGDTAAVMAVAMGAQVFEKHFTLNHGLSGPDHWFSEDPDSLKSWVCSIREAYLMRGSNVLVPTEAELNMRAIARRSITAIKCINIGEKFSEENIAMRRPGDGLPAKEWDSVIGKTANRKILSGHQITREDIDD